MLPSAAELEYFLEVSRTLNISRAAERIGVSQPTLTQSIRKLENIVGSELLIRSRSGVRLTRSGQRIANQASAILESWGSLQKLALQDEFELRGSFKLGVHPSVARYTLPNFFRELSNRAPEIEIELVHDLSRLVTEGIINFKLDFGFVINPVTHPDLVLKKLCEDTVAIFAAEEGRYGNLLFGDPDLMQTQFILRKLKSQQTDFAKFVPTRNLDVVHRLVSAGAGYGILPSLIAQSEESVPLKVVDVKLPTFRDELFLAYRKDVMTSKAAKALIEISKKALSPA